MGQNKGGGEFLVVMVGEKGGRRWQPWWLGGGDTEETHKKENIDS